MNKVNLSPRFQNAEHFQNFWSHGNGRELKDWSKAELSFQNFEKFAPLYYQVDELGDQVVKDTFFQMPFHEAMKLIETSCREPFSDKTELPDSLKELLNLTQEKPTWLNNELLKSGAELCRRSGINSLIVLRDYSLMGGYDYAYLNKPLILTGTLKKGAVKRLSDTLEFWVNVSRENALEPQKKGYEFCIKTRLIHSYSRLMLLKNSENWNIENWGKPINHWDMMATYFGFSLVFLHGLKKLNVKFSSEEEAGLFHLWKYVGFLIGIPPEYLPENKKQATEQFYLWTSIQPSSDQDSVLLAKSLLDENLENTIFKYQFQRKNLRYLHICMNWHLLDREVNQRLQIPKVWASKLFPNFLWVKNYLFQKLNSRNKQIKIGDEAQMKVVTQYRGITSPLFHHH